MKVCIVGASGKLGRYMVQHALDRGYEVVGVCRAKSVSKLDEWAAPRSVGTVGLILNPILYGGLKWFAPQIAFLDRMAICFGVVLVVLGIMTRLWPLEKPIDLPVNPSMDLTSSATAKFFGGVVVVLTLMLYGVFF